MNDGLRGRYLIVLPSDRILTGQYFGRTVGDSPWNGVVNSGFNDQLGDVFPDNPEKLMTTGVLWGQAGTTQSAIGIKEKAFPATHMTDEDSEGNYYTDYPGFIDFHHSQYWLEQLGDTNFNKLHIRSIPTFVDYLKHRGYIVDVAVMMRRRVWHDVVPDLTVHPLVTEDWAKLAYEHNPLYWETNWYNQPFGGHSYGGSGQGEGNVKPGCLLAHINWYKARYKNTNAPLKHVLLVGHHQGNHGSSDHFYVPGMYTDPFDSIPVWSRVSYTYNMENVANYPWTIMSEDYMNDSGFSETNYAENGYDDVTMVCDAGWQSGGEIFDKNQYNYVVNNITNNCKSDDDNPQDCLDSNNQIYGNLDGNNNSMEEVHSVGHFINQPTSFATKRYEIDVENFRNPVGYYTFAHLELLNSDWCSSPDGGVPAYGVCHHGGQECMISEEDSIHYGCRGGGCQGFSEQCYPGRIDRQDPLKEYLGNSLHVGVNYAGPG